MSQSASCLQLTAVDSDLTQQQQKVTVAYTNQPCRRKLQFINGKFAVQKPQTSTVQKRNERERNRVKLINRTFATLRDCLPPKYAGKKAKKLSKVEVLKTATGYIAYLARLLRDDDCSRQQQQQLSYRQDVPQAQTAVATSTDYQQNQQSLQHQLMSTVSSSSLGVCCDLSVLLDDSNAVQHHQHQHQQQQLAPQKPASSESTADSEQDESGIFQLSSEEAESSTSPWMMQQLVPVVPPLSGLSCYAFSTPIKPTDDVEAFCFYPVASAAAPAMASGSDSRQDLQVLSISDVTDGCSSYMQFI